MRAAGRRAWIAGAAAGLAAPWLARAEGTYPDHPVRIIVPFAGGGGNDVLARLYGQKLQERLGQTFIAENRPGAGGQVGTEQAIRAKPDGYTLVVNPSGPVLYNPGSTEPAYDQTRDLAPIAVLATFPTFLLVALTSPQRTLQDLLAWEKESPGRATYGFGGLAFQMLAEQINHRAGAKMQPIVYRGSQDAINAVSTGDLTLALTDPGPALAALDGKRVRALAISTPTRWARLPEVPTVIESGFPGLTLNNWIGLLAPAGTPAPILATLEAAVAEAAKAPDVADRLRPLGMEPDGTGQAGFRAMIAADNETWHAVAKEAGISLSR